MPCSGFTFGRFCSKNCSCVRENSIGCNNEDGTCECKANSYGANCQRSCDLNCLENKVHTLTNDKMTLEQHFQDHKTASDQKLTDHKSALEQKLINDKAALEIQVGDYKHHLTWYSSLTCAAFVLLFLAISKMYLKNRKLKADLKVVSVRYSEKQRSDSISETKVTFTCAKTAGSPNRSNLFTSVLSKFRLLTQNLPTESNSQPIYGTSLLEETDQINANIYAAIDELKEKNAKEEIDPNARELI